MNLEVTAIDRAKLWHLLIGEIENYLDNVNDTNAGCSANEDDVGLLMSAFDFDQPIAATEAVNLAIRGLRDLQPNGRHPRYFGFFDAAPTTMSIIGDTLAATFNACLATRAGSPFGTATEAKLVAAFGARFGYPPDQIDGIATSGGSESNLSALLLALTHRLPGYPEVGVAGTDMRPVVYVSPEAHPSVPRAARHTGLGAGSVRVVRTDHAQRMDMAELERMIAADLRAGRLPLAVMLTAGTTGSGVIDPIDAAADLAARYGLWLHVDAAWGGAAALLPEPDPAFRGLARADSLTFDPHKWMSVPLGLGLLLTRHRGLLERTFAVGSSFVDAHDEEPESFARSLRWSRGFASLKLLLSLSVLGWDGFEKTLRQQMWLGAELRRRLSESGWEIVNDTPLPLICFVPEDPAEQDPGYLRLVATAINSAGDARIFVVKTGGRHVLRACITNYATTEADVIALVALLADAARQVRGNPARP